MVRIKIRIRVTVRVGVTFNVRVYHYRDIVARANVVHLIYTVSKQPLNSPTSCPWPHLLNL